MTTVHSSGGQEGIPALLTCRAVEEVPALLAKARETLYPVGFLTCLDFAGALGFALARFQLLCLHSAGPDPLAVSSAH